MAEQRDLAVAAGRGAGVGHDRVELVDQRLRRPVGLRDAAAQRVRVLAVAEEVEGDRDVAVARQRDREGLHQLSRAGEAVGDHDDRGGPAVLRAEDGGRRAGDVEGGDGEAVRRANKLHQREDDCGQRENRNGNAVSRRAHPPPLRGGRCVLDHAALASCRST